jgi:hypothetical protein
VQHLIPSARGLFSPQRTPGRRCASSP